MAQRNQLGGKASIIARCAVFFLQPFPPFSHTVWIARALKPQNQIPFAAETTPKKWGSVKYPKPYSIVPWCPTIPACNGACFNLLSEPIQHNAHANPCIRNSADNEEQNPK